MVISCVFIVPRNNSLRTYNTLGKSPAPNACVFRRNLRPQAGSLTKELGPKSREGHNRLCHSVRSRCAAIVSSANFDFILFRKLPNLCTLVYAPPLHPIAVVRHPSALAAPHPTSPFRPHCPTPSSPPPNAARRVRSLIDVLGA